MCRKDSGARKILMPNIGCRSNKKTEHLLPSSFWSTAPRSWKCCCCETKFTVLRSFMVFSSKTPKPPRKSSAAGHHSHQSQFQTPQQKKKKKKSHMFYFICIRKVENHWVRRCRLSGGAMSLGSDLEIPVCSFCLLDQGVSSQCFLLPCLCASITDSNSLKQKPQLNSFFCKFSWPWCFITATKGNETAGHSGAFL